MFEDSPGKKSKHPLFKRKQKRQVYIQERGYDGPLPRGQECKFHTADNYALCQDYYHKFIGWRNRAGQQHWWWFRASFGPFYLVSYGFLFIENYSQMKIIQRHSQIHHFTEAQISGGNPESK